MWLKANEMQPRFSFSVDSLLGRKTNEADIKSECLGYTELEERAGNIILHLINIPTFFDLIRRLIFNFLENFDIFFWSGDHVDHDREDVRDDKLETVNEVNDSHESSSHLKEETESESELNVDDDDDESSSPLSSPRPLLPAPLLPGARPPFPGLAGLQDLMRPVHPMASFPGMPHSMFDKGK